MRQLIGLGQPPIFAGSGDSAGAGGGASYVEPQVINVDDVLAITPGVKITESGPSALEKRFAQQYPPFTLAAVPWWAWVALAVGAYWLLNKGGRRRMDW